MPSWAGFEHWKQGKDRIHFTGICPAETVSPLQWAKTNHTEEINWNVFPSIYYTYLWGVWIMWDLLPLVRGRVRSKQGMFWNVLLVQLNPFSRTECENSCNQTRTCSLRNRFVLSYMIRSLKNYLSQSSLCIGRKRDKASQYPTTLLQVTTETNKIAALLDSSSG